MRSFLMIPVFLLLVTPLSAQSELAFAHMAVGGNPAYETVLQIVNEVESTVSVGIDVFQGGLAGSSNGSPLTVRFDDGTVSASRSIALSPFQEFTTILSGTGATLRNGWVRVRSVTPGGKISGNLLFRQRSGSTLVGSVGVTGAQRFRRGIIQIDHRESGSDSGVAFANPDAVSVMVTLDLFRGPNRIASPVQVTLQPNQHFAKLVSEMFPTLWNQQATLVIETAANRSIPFVALRLDGSHLTSIPVRPLGFTFQYTVTGDGGAAVETGLWQFDFASFNLIGAGTIESPVRAEIPEATGSWMGTNFQFRYRKTLPGNTVGMVVFNGTSAGPESTVDANGKSKAVTGRVTTIGADGQVVSVNNFSAFHRFGLPAQ